MQKSHRPDSSHYCLCYLCFPSPSLLFHTTTSVCPRIVGRRCVSLDSSGHGSLPASYYRSQGVSVYKRGEIASPTPGVRLIGDTCAPITTRKLWSNGNSVKSARLSLAPAIDSSLSSTGEHLLVPCDGEKEENFTDVGGNRMGTRPSARNDGVHQILATRGWVDWQLQTGRTCESLIVFKTSLKECRICCISFRRTAKHNEVNRYFYPRNDGQRKCT